MAETLTSGLCTPWPIDEECCVIPDGMPKSRVEMWKLVASEILWRASGMRYGPGCAIEVRPCGKDCWDELIGSGFLNQGQGYQSTGGRIPYTVDGRWYNLACSCNGDSCHCGDLCEIRLDGPVHDIIEVKVDGKVLDPAMWRLDAPNRFVRLDGECFEKCQNLEAPDTEKGTASITYRIGVPLDALGLQAVSELWCSLVRGDTCGKHEGECGCGECGALQKNVRRVNRQGVSYEYSPDESEIRGFQGLTPLAQAWLALVNPDKLTRAGTVRSPDRRLPRNRIIGQWGRR